MKKRTLSTLILVLALATASLAQKADLRLKLEAGKTYSQQLEMKAKIIQDINGMEMEVIMEMDGKTDYMVKEVLDNAYKLEVSYKSLAITMGMPQGSVEFSSDNPDETDAFSKILSAMTGNSFDLTMTNRGRIEEISGLDGLWDEVIDDVEGVSEMEKDQIKGQIMNAYGEKGMKSNIEAATAIFPEEPVKKGEVWTVNTTMEAGMSAKASTTYKYLGKKGDLALIEGKGVIETLDNDSYTEANGMKMRIEISGTTECEISIMRKTGWIARAVIAQNTEGVTHIKDNPQVPGGMEIPMKMSNKQVITGQ